MADRKSILVVGVTQASVNAPDHIKQAGGNLEQLKEKIGSMMQAAKLAGLDIEARQIDPEQPEPGTQAVMKLLEGRAWDAFIVGFGVRGDPSLTLLFEDLVNGCRVRRPATKMGFTTSPLDIIATAERMFSSA